MPYHLSPLWWVALAVGAVALVTAFVLAASDLGESLGVRDWPRVTLFGLAALAAFGLVVLAAVRSGLLTVP